MGVADLAVKNIFVTDCQIWQESVVLQELLSHERDFVSACGLLGLGAEYAAVKGAKYTKVLFQLSKGMVRKICSFNP